MLSLEARLCPICGTNAHAGVAYPERFDATALGDFAFASRKLPEYMHWQLRRCRACDLLFADPAPTPAELGRLYREAAFDSGREAGLAARTYGRYLRPVAAALAHRAGGSSRPARRSPPRPPTCGRSSARACSSRAGTPPIRSRS